MGWEGILSSTSFQLDLFSCRAHFLGHGVGEEIEEILVDEVLRDAVADIDIVETVIVRVEEQGAPGPVGGATPL